ncbi:MAG: hypothetical protein DRN65_00030 [Thaumarchaeota archaeon]|nr:MAG: hypothetical protein DRN65_00030 [Nitrososphaerota archaeon]
MQELSEYKEYITKITSDLVKINSENPPGREKEAAEYVVERLKELGVHAWIDEFAEKRANAMGVIERGEGAGLLFVSHLDTVPAGNKELWSVPPFSGLIKDGKIFGRGAADDKGCVAAMLGALKMLADEDWPIRGRLIFAAVGDEEVGSGGIKRLISQGVRADYAVVGEPTKLNIYSAHNGGINFSVKFLGKSAHASQPFQGINAIYAASDFALKIEKLAIRLRKKRTFTGSPSISLTIIKGGVKSNIIPDSCESILDRRITPEEDPDKVIETVRKIAEKVAKTRRVKIEFKVMRVIPPAETDRKSEIVQAALKAASKVLGKKIRLKGLRATCDMTFLVNEAHIPTIIFGPGDLKQCHAVDEWVSIEELRKGAEIYKEIAVEILK